MSTENIHTLAGWVFVHQKKGAFYCDDARDMIQVLKGLDCEYNEEFFITSLCKFILQACEDGKQNGSLTKTIKELKEKNIQTIYDLAPGLSKHIYRYQRSIDKWKVRCPFFNGNCVKNVKFK